METVSTGKQQHIGSDLLHYRRMHGVGRIPDSQQPVLVSCRLVMLARGVVQVADLPRSVRQHDQGGVFLVFQYMSDGNGVWDVSQSPPYTR